MAGVQVWAGGEACAEEVVTSGNGVCGFRSHGSGSVLRIFECTASGSDAHQEVDRGRIEVLEAPSRRVLMHG